jgi:hypothetical protein
MPDTLFQEDNPTLGHRKNHPSKTAPFDPNAQVESNEKMKYTDYNQVFSN